MSLGLRVLLDSSLIPTAFRSFMFVYIFSFEFFVLQFSLLALLFLIYVLNRNGLDHNNKISKFNSSYGNKISHFAKKKYFFLSNKEKIF